MKRKLAMMLAVMCLIISVSTVSYAAEGNAKTTAQARATGNSNGEIGRASCRERVSSCV